MTELAVGDGCGLKLDLTGVDSISAFNSGGIHHSEFRPLAVNLTREIIGANWDYDDLGEMKALIAQRGILQPGLDAGHRWIEAIEMFQVSTMDAMTPPTNNPEAFGRIAALHVMSDLWVSGVRPETMLQYLVVPSRPDQPLLGEILRGFKDTCDQFNVEIIGGHTRQEGNQYLLGGATTGYTKKRYDTQSRPKEGDLIMMTKALGTSVGIAALKMTQQGYSDGLPETALQTFDAAQVSMTTDNGVGIELRRNLSVTSCTDITGFGLVGHLSNLLNPVDKGAVIHLEQLPILDGAMELVEAGVHTHAGDRAQIDHALWQGIDTPLNNDPRFDLAFLPETSGGVLVTASRSNHEGLASIVEEFGQTLTVIGEVTPGSSVAKDYRFANIKLL